MKLKINIENYESFAIDFLEGNLTGEDLIEFQLFLAQNPDIKSEFENFEQIELEPQKIVFDDKYLLKKTEMSETLNCSYFEELCIAKIEDDLSIIQQNELNKILKNDKKNEKIFSLFSKTKLVSDSKIIYPNKSKLKKTIYLNRSLYYSISAIAALFIIFFGIKLFIKPTDFTNSKLANLNEFNISNSRTYNVFEPQNIDNKIQNNAKTNYIKKIDNSLQNNDIATNNIENINKVENFEKIETFKNINQIEEIQNLQAITSTNLTTTKNEIKYFDAEPTKKQSFSQLSISEQYEYAKLAKEELKQKIENKIIKQSQVTPIELAETAIKGFNTLTESDINLSKITDENGNVTALSITTPLIDFFTNKISR